MFRNTIRLAGVLGARRCDSACAQPHSFLLAGRNMIVSAPTAITVVSSSKALIRRVASVAVLAQAGQHTRFLSTTPTSCAPVYTELTTDAEGRRIYRSVMPSVIDRVSRERTLYEYVMKRLKAQDPRRIATVQAESGKELTYAKLIRATDWSARALYHYAKVRKGDVVCVCMLNTIIYGAVVYSVLRLGGIVSPVNAVADPPTLAYFLETSDAKVILGMRYFRQQLEEAVSLLEKNTGRKVDIHYPEDFFKRWYIWPVPRSYDGLQGATLDDTILIPFSSGTGGLPKGVKLTNRALIANSEQSGEGFSMTPDDACVAVLPFFHIYGFTVCLNSTYVYGVKQIVMYKYTVEDYLKACERYKATINPVAPPILISLLKNEDKTRRTDLSSLKKFCSGAAPLGPETVEELRKILPRVEIVQGYGMTEMSPVVTAPIKDQQCTPGCCGSLIADTELRIVRVDDSQQSGSDKSAGIDVEPGAEGEVWVRGPQMMKGYLRDEDTAECMQDGWYRTGDIGKLLESGELMITDRLKELIKYKGFQVSPASLEALLLTHPWVNDCVVIGVPDPRDVGFENPRALVVLQPSVSPKEAVRASDELYRFVMKRMPPHKRLHGGVRIVDEIPRNAAGKLLRRKVRTDEAALIKSQMVQANLGKTLPPIHTENVSISG